VKVTSVTIYVCSEAMDFKDVGEYRQVGLGLNGCKYDDLDGSGVYYEIWNMVQLQGLGKKGTLMSLWRYNLRNKFCTP
jgi:hypothetical protein